MHSQSQVVNAFPETVNYPVEKYGGNLDILLSNAGIIGPRTSILDLDLEAFDNTVTVKLRGVVVKVKHAARAMVAKKTRGSIICTSSTSVCLRGARPHSYTTYKHALIGLVGSACGELGAHGMRVNSLSLAGVVTPLSSRVLNRKPSGVKDLACACARLAGIVLNVRHVAEVGLFPASDGSAYVNGHNLVVDGGFAAAAPSPIPTTTANC